MFGLFWRRVTRPGVWAGILTGVGVVAALILTGNDPFYGINAGFVGLAVNTCMTVLVSLFGKPMEAVEEAAAIPVSTDGKG